MRNHINSCKWQINGKLGFQIFIIAVRSTQNIPLSIFNFPLLHCRPQHPKLATFHFQIATKKCSHHLVTAFFISYLKFVHKQG